MKTNLAKIIKVQISAIRTTLKLTILGILKVYELYVFEIILKTTKFVL